ncbi:MAG: glycosyltransferase family 4 protein [Snowella sp.]|nr:glycosyltransferase family 4 protein [Snowella sp.]
MKNLFQQGRKLLVVNQFFPPDFAPTGQLIYELVTYLGKKGASIKVFTGQPAYAFNSVNPAISASAAEKQHNVSIRRTRATQVSLHRIRGKAVHGLLFTVRAILHLLRNLKRDDILLLTTAPPFLPFIGYLLHLIKGSPYVCLIYDLYPDVAEELGVIPADNWLIKLWNALNRWTWREAEQVIVLSSSMKQRILQKQPRLAPKISVISNWSDPDWIVPLEKKENWFAQEHGLTEKFTVLYSGNMGRCHDIQTILKTAHLLKGHAVQFVFIGGGPKYKIAQNFVQQWGIDNCLFLPYQDKEVLPYSLTACDLTLVSVEEGMGGIVAPSKFYSLLATGRPIAVVCDSQCYLHDLVQKQGCGVTIANHDSQGLAEFILNLILHPELARKMGKAGRHYLESQCTLDIIAQQYAQVLKLNVETAQPLTKVQVTSFP